MNKRTITLFLLASLAAGIIGCASDAPPADTKTPETTAPEESPYDENGFLRDNLPEDLNLGGRKVTVYVRGDTIATEFDGENDGDVVNDAMYARNIAVEDRLNVDLEFFSNTSADFWGEREKYMNTVRQSVMTGDGSIDLVAGLSVIMPILMQDGLFFDLLADDLPYLDFSQPWWPQHLIEEISIGGRLHFASGEASLGVIKGMMGFYFNKNMLADLKLEDPYALVDAGKWTFDKLSEMAVKGYHDVNGDTKVDEGDRMGFVVQNENHATNFLNAAGLRFVEPDDKGELTLMLGSEKTADLMAMLNTMLKQPGFVIKKDNSTVYEKNFMNNLALFATGEFGTAETYRELPFDFGIIPFPKYDEAQDGYYTAARSTFTGFSIPVTAEKSDVAAVLECFASESYRKVSPAFYESALKVKYSRDDVSARMFDLIKNGVSYDFGITFNQVLDSVSVKVRGQICQLKEDWASTYAGFKDSVNQKLKTYTDTIKNLEQ